MNDSAHRHVPVGPKHDPDESARQYKASKDDDTAYLSCGDQISDPELKLYGLADCPRHGQVTVISPEAYAVKAAGEPSETRTGNCPACWHLWKLHGPRGCTAASSPASLDPYVCPCEHSPDDEDDDDSRRDRQRLGRSI